MKTLITIFIITFLFNINAFAQRENKTNGRGQESDRKGRIERNQNNKNKTDINPGTIQHPPKRQIEIHSEIPPRKNPGVPIEGDYQYYCPEITPTCKVLVDNVYLLSYEQKAIQCFESGDFSGAIINLNFALGDDPSNASLYFLRGKAYFALYDYIQAKSDFTTVNVLDPVNAETYYYRGMCNLYLGDKNLAMKDFEFAASLGDALAQKVLLEFYN